jgi:hypothetical protein
VSNQTVHQTRITNEGGDDILISHYDQQYPLGFRISGGSLLRAEILSTSNEYLRQRLRIDTTHADTALFTPVILEPNEWFTVKSLILHSEGARPTLQALGKIAGVRNIRVVDSTEVVADVGFLVTSFAGGLWVQAARLVAYFLGFILLLAAVIAPTAAISGFLAKRRRRKHVAQFKSLTKRTLTDRDEYIFERYIVNDFPYLLMLERAVSDEKRLNQAVERHQKESRHVAYERWEDESVVLASSNAAPPSYVFRRHLAVEDMIKSGFIFKQEGRWHVDRELNATLNEFVQFLRIKGVDYPEARTTTRTRGAEQEDPADAKDGAADP